MQEEEAHLRQTEVRNIVFTKKFLHKLACGGFGFLKINGNPDGRYFHILKSREVILAYT